tara:strand:- start:17 stop:1024 length:1008 start_codon:yes stop_codon:yes gene_type:complete
MKLLFENWRQYLNERKTDEIYAGLIDLFVDVYSNDSNFEYASEEEEREYEGEPVDWGKYADLLATAAKAQGTNDKTGPKPLEEYEFYLIEPRKYEIVEKIASIDPDEQLYPSKSDVEGEKLPSMLIKFDKDSGALGSWIPDDKQIVLYFDKLMDEETYRKVLTSNESVREVLRTHNYRSLLRQVMEHELTHYLNWVRAGATTRDMARQYWKSKKGKQMINYFNQNFPGYDKNTEVVKKQISYINSTEEMQARLIPVFNQIKKFVNSDSEDPTEDHILIKKELEKDSPDTRKIIKHTKNIYDSYFPHFWELTLDHLKKKTLQRIYQFAVQLIKLTK